MQTLQKAHPEWWIGYTAYGTAGQLDESIWDYDVDFLALEETDIRYVCCRWPDRIRLCQAIRVWTVESESSALKYYEMGADGVITNEPCGRRRLPGTNMFQITLSHICMKATDIPGRIVRIKHNKIKKEHCAAGISSPGSSHFFIFVLVLKRIILSIRSDFAHQPEVERDRV